MAPFDEEYKQKIDYIISNRQPLEGRARKLYDIIKSAGGKILSYNITFSKALYPSGNSQSDFVRILDECIEKDYVRTYMTPTKERKNWFFTFEYWSLDLLPKIQNSEVFQFHTQYIEYKWEEGQPRK